MFRQGIAFENVRHYGLKTLAESKAGKLVIDVRSVGEFKGEMSHMPRNSLGKECSAVDTFHRQKVCHGRLGPGTMGPSDRSKNWGETYVENLGFEPSEHTFVYCRIGERSSHTGGGGIPRPHTDEFSWTKTWWNSSRLWMLPASFRGGEPVWPWAPPWSLPRPSRSQETYIGVKSNGQEGIFYTAPCIPLGRASTSFFRPSATPWPSIALYLNELISNLT
jgi:hypothetical protein